jgi:hypothetical protein
MGCEGREEREWKVANPLATFFFLPSFGGPHDGLCHQGQRPKTVEATILASLLNK